VPLWFKKALHKKEEYFSRKGAKAQRRKGAQTRSATAFLKGFLCALAPLRENLFVIAALLCKAA
jgi:hypothetical protein